MLWPVVCSFDQPMWYVVASELFVALRGRAVLFSEYGAGRGCNGNVIVWNQGEDGRRLRVGKSASLLVYISIAEIW